MYFKKNVFYTIVFIFISNFQICFSQNSEKVYLDNGIVKWSESSEEVALFGANYCLPSACDYRAAKTYSKNLKVDIEKDMSHFVRMGWDGLRVCFWGDFQNTDKEGNLINNEHLDLMDYLIYEADKREIKMLLSPIVTYNSQWPDLMDVPVTGFSTHFKKSELGTNPLAIAAQQNYISKLLNHVNPYTGRAVKDEPGIIFVEMINEPWHHSDDLQGSVSYINSLVDAVRSTGCDKIVFHNVSQDFKIAKAMKESNIQGASFAWYPSGLNSGHTLKGNFLRTVDTYDLMKIPELDGLAKIVYEFDQPDLNTPYMYPAMVRTFRSVGAQFAAIFSYDMLSTAKSNLGWQTHYVNLVYTPQKAVGAIIASEAMHNLPLYKEYGSYPSNTKFGDFKVSYEDCLSEFNNSTTFMYAGTTKSKPVNEGELSKIVGFGSSEVIEYAGFGSYFLDKVENGIWRLEVYPDAVFPKDPFALMSSDKIVSRLLFKSHVMKVNLKDLGKEFLIKGIDEGNEMVSSTYNGEFRISPGVYTLVKRGIGEVTLPSFLSNGIPFKQYIVPEVDNRDLEIVHEPVSFGYSNQKINISASLYDEEKIDSVKLFIKPRGSWFRSIKMKPVNGYNYISELPEELMKNGFLDYVITAYQGNNVTTFPSKLNKTPEDWNFYSKESWELEILEPQSPITVFSPKSDIEKLSFTRIGDAIRHGIFSVYPIKEDVRGAVKLKLPVDLDPKLTDYTFSLFIGDYIGIVNDESGVKGFNVSGRGPGKFVITLVEKDGTAWSSLVSFGANWEFKTLSIDDFKKDKAVMLPQGYPGNWNYWLESAENRDSKKDLLNVRNIELLQISIRPEKTGAKDVEIGAIEMF